MGQRIILSEEEKRNIQEMYGLVNEQPSNTGKLLKYLESIPTVQEKLAEFLPILIKTKEELRDIRREEKVNQVINVNMSNNDIIESINDLWHNDVRGTEFAEDYIDQLIEVKKMVTQQKIDYDYLNLKWKWLKDVLFLSREEFENFGVEEFTDLLNKHRVPIDKDGLINHMKELYNKIPKALRYRVNNLSKMINYDMQEIFLGGPK